MAPYKVRATSHFSHSGAPHPKHTHTPQPLLSWHLLTWHLLLRRAPPSPNLAGGGAAARHARRQPVRRRARQ
eukprot:5275959-Prymnesium_polylepis.2